MMKKQDSVFVPLIIALSVIIPIVVALLMLFPDVFHIESESIDFSSLPFFHAILNGSTAVLLLTGFVLIKNKKANLHKAAMLSAFVLSSVFLVSYVTSKLTNAPVPFEGEGVIRYVYFFILISHIILSVFVLPLALFSIYRGMTGEIAKHKSIVKYTFPIWMYVAITGVLVYILMSPYY
jgi:putative membrane protein